MKHRISFETEWNAVVRSRRSQAVGCAAWLTEQEALPRVEAEGAELVRANCADGGGEDRTQRDWLGGVGDAAGRPSFDEVLAGAELLLVLGSADSCVDFHPARSSSVTA